MGRMLGQDLAGKVLKGLYSALLAALSALAAILVDGTTFADVTDGQWVTIAAFTLGAFGGTFGLAGWAGPHDPRAGGPPPGGP